VIVSRIFRTFVLPSGDKVLFPLAPYGIFLVCRTNLPPEYFGAEKRFKEAATSQEKIKALEDLISTVPKHKGTDKLRADLRKKLSQLREESNQKKKSGKGDLYTIEKQGLPRSPFAGFPNSGNHPS